MRKSLHHILSILSAFMLLTFATTAQNSYKVIYVTYDATADGDGLSWNSPTTLTTALNKAGAGDEIWIKGYNMPDKNAVYVAPKEGFTVKSGVRLYGGFKGDETAIGQRTTDSKAYRMSYRTVITGDISRNDSPDKVNMIFPSNSLRDDNAVHVLTLNLDPSLTGNNNALPTIVNGITIIRGHATGTTANIPQSGKGGGMYVTNNSTSTKSTAYRIEQCFFIGNYATQGGGLYVDASADNAENIVNRCGFFNNAAGNRELSENKGAAIWMEGTGTIVNSVIFNNENGGLMLANANALAINSTIARNTGSGIDGAQAFVWNSVVWGNTNLSTSDAKPTFNHSALPDAETATGADNIKLADRNNEENGPHFASPSLKIGFDRDFNILTELYPIWAWDPTESTLLMDVGDDNIYENDKYGTTDLNDNQRKRGTIDIGAYEFQPIEEGRIRYVTTNGTGDGTSWENASNDLQKMIDDLAENNLQNLPGEVWVAEGTYIPNSRLIPTILTSASFRMRDGISVYGGFKGDETTKQARTTKPNGKPWDYQYTTVLRGADYDDSNLSYSQHAWTLSSNSTHVVWFAPLGDDAPFTRTTTLDGVTIKGGHAAGTTGEEMFKTDCGAGVYMVGQNTQLTRCIVTENYAVGNGGGVWVKNGVVESSLIYNNNADANGGAIYIENYGMVHRSMLTNNSAQNGAGAYLDNNIQEAGSDHPEYLIVSTCVVSNNTGRSNGAIYCNRGGVVLQSTVTNNYCPMATDAAESNASQTGGLYLNEYGVVVNSVIWNNRIGASNNMEENTNVPMYARNPQTQNIRFYYNAISGVNNALWNNTLLTQTLRLVDRNALSGDGTAGGDMGPRFSTGGTMDSEDKLVQTIGAQGNWRTIDYYWEPMKGSNLWAGGMSSDMMPDEVMQAPEIDLGGGLFAQKPAIGAFHVDKATIRPELNNRTLTLYVNSACTDPEHDGHSWATAYRSLNDAILYFAQLTNGSTPEVFEGESKKNYPVTNQTEFVIKVQEGTLWPRYSFVNEDPKSVSIILRRITAGTQKLRIEGGYHFDGVEAVQAPLTYRSIINGNIEGRDITESLYHVITVESNAQVELDGFHIINGYAANTATLQYGAGMLVYDGANVALRNCIFENNTAVNGAAIDARNATLSMTNCVVNNNTNQTESDQIIHAPNLTLNHVTIINNIGAAPGSIGNSSFSAGNTSGNTFDDIETLGQEGAQHFANPTRSRGATLGFSTWLGGYASFRPSTGSTKTSKYIINKVTTTTDMPVTDIDGYERNLGGVPDLGAYEADLPEAGRVYYVRTAADGGNDGNDGLSWGTAFATLEKALDVAETNKETVKEIWVSEGIYTHKSTDKIHAQNYAYKFVEGVNVYGGFSKSGAPNKKDRNPKMYESILQPGITNPEEMAKNKNKSFGRVLVQADAFNTETVYDGFTLRNGYLFSCFQENIVGNIANVSTDRIGQTGGAGVYLMNNGVLENCIVTDNLVLVHPYNTNMDKTGDNSGGFHQAGAGIYNTGGTIKNCQIIQNKLWHIMNNNGAGGSESAWMYGSGLYMNDGNVYNTILCNNSSKVIRPDNHTYNGYHEVCVGSVFLVKGNFYNNTIVNNEAFICQDRQTNYVKIALSGVYVYTDITMYNCIVANNNDDIGVYKNNDNGCIYNYPVAAFNVSGSGADVRYTVNASIVKTHYSCINIDESSNKNLCTTNDTQKTNIYKDPILDQTYRATAESPVLNAGTENIPNVTLPDYDADYTARVKDCTIDMGAYEYDNQENIIPESENNKYTYYVTQTGYGKASGEDLANAACAMKLQDVLYAAGTQKQQHPTAEVIVKIAGYTDENGFVYHANRLTDPSNPKSYSFLIPYGVTVEGGYFDEENADWDDPANREILTHRTVFSAICEATATTQAVTGYHAVTFGEKPDDWTDTDEQQTVIDGVWLTDGSATSMAGKGNVNTRGGGAIVAAWAHVRNCIVTNCNANEGGGLYLLPGATVSGTAILSNSADEGGGIYAENGMETYATEGGDKVSADKRAHLISCTLADNTATSIGGGLYLEDGAAMSTNCVIWGNDAPSDKNVSGVVSTLFEDNRWTEVFEIAKERQTAYYPFNSCFVENQEMPADFENNAMKSDGAEYFVDAETLKDFRLKEFSPLINRGTPIRYQTQLEKIFNVTPQDMQKIDRAQIQYGAERIDAGAFAYDGGILPDPARDIFTRLFVNPGSKVQLKEGHNSIDYLGKSFLTPFASLNDALNYIAAVREKNPTYETTRFEILISSGTFKPSVLRNDFATNIPYSQRLYTFTVPHGVGIYGGFKGDEPYACNKLTTIPTTEGDKAVSYEANIAQLLDARTFSDFNQNGIEEPWELAEQTILSGEINVSAEANNVYKIIYTNAKNTESPLPVYLDGLTIKDGETYNELSDVDNENEAGRGGGVYSHKVDYTISRCRFLNNFAVRGGAVYVRNARLNLIGCSFMSNGTVKEATSTNEKQKPRGGAVYVADINNKNTKASLHAVNCLFANNETTGDGGAIGTTYNDNESTNVAYVTPTVDLMNCTFVRNKANKNAVLYNFSNQKDPEQTSKIVNTLIWGNESTGQDVSTDISHLAVSYSASDYNYGDVFTEGNAYHNILLNEENMHMDGPHFTRPSQKAGVEGYTGTGLWNPIAISMTTDKGLGEITLNDDGTLTDDIAEGGYAKWFETNGLTAYKGIYMPTQNTGKYNRYSGPLDETTGTQTRMPIDIGLYEYRYTTGFPTMTAIYVATQESGDGSGSSWNNATSDLRNAIIGAAHPKQQTGARTIYVRDGQYDLPRLSSTGTAFTLDMQNSSLSNSITLKGSCTGNGSTQDFSKPSVIRTHKQIIANRLLEINIPEQTEGNTVTVEGFTFISDKLNESSSDESGNGVEAGVGNKGRLILKNCAFRHNLGKGVKIKANKGTILIYNTLFADNNTGLENNETGDHNTTLVNTTFANNKVADVTGNVTAYNTVSWNNATQYITETTDNHNKVFAASTSNEHIKNGPNFIDPENEDIEARNYRIRPSLTLLNKGDNAHYLQQVLNDATTIPADEKELGNRARLTDGTIDIGAYEYEAELQPIIYVKANLIGTADGKNWQTALGDLQGAADLAGIYAHNHENEKGYVFVHNNVHNVPLHIQLPNTTIYGGMNDELTTETETGKIVEALLDQRKGLIESDNSTTLSLITINAEATNSAADGFVIEGEAAVHNGYLATSVVNNAVTGTASGTLYNTLVKGTVSGVKAVNVTATETIENVTGSQNNRANVTETNRYVTEGNWAYQLNETSSDAIDKGDNSATQTCIAAVGHTRDIAGNLRIRRTVDHGCFETWDITEDHTAGDTDYPHGKSVVYVREGKELQLNRDYTAANPFNPGVLLLEHQAGLRGNGKAVALSHLIVERKVAAHGTDMAYMPFNAQIENPNNVPLKHYDGARRAAYDYTFDSQNGTAWQPTANFGYTGLLLDNTDSDQEHRVRFTAQGTNVYTEDQTDKSVTLRKYNFNDTWSSASNGGNRFTHKENMSWNLFGSSYLCAMNYADMAYGRVIYGYADNSYRTVNTGEEATGYIPAGDAIFTQTATLKENETFTVTHPTAKTGTPYQAAKALTVTLTKALSTRADEVAATDLMQLNAVSAAESRNDFEMGSDGVKWMVANAPQIYALHAHGRYSLLSAVNMEGSVNVGVSVPESGIYTLSIPADCNTDRYETVILEDAVTGRVTDLLERAYDFTVSEADDIADRFTLRFNRMISDHTADVIQAWSEKPGEIHVKGVRQGDRITLYNASGMQMQTLVATSDQVLLTDCGTGIVLVEVKRDSHKTAIRKVRVR